MTSLARLAAILLGLLVVAALLGALDGFAAEAVALVAVCEIVFLLSRIRHLRRAMIASSPTAADHRRMIRSRRLSAQLRDLRSAADSLQDAVVLIDPEGHARWFNRAAERLLGLMRPRDRGVSLVEHLGETDLGTWLGEGAPESITYVAAPTDPAIHLHVALIPYGHAQRLLLARDVSHLTRLEKVRRDFVANVSHELRTPLTVIHGYLELLDPEDSPQLAPVLAEMRTQSRRMDQIVADLLTLSRLEMQQQLADEPVAMAPLLATLRKEAAALSHDRHEIMLEDLADADLLGSPKDLYSAFSNLVSNAVRYTPTGGRIVIRWQRTDEGAEFAVIDSGYGIPASHLARLTERFYRVSSSRSRETGGTGLGLSIVKHVLNLHDAQLRVTSEPGRGSTYACVFGAVRVLEVAREVE
jgi:two-component system phosphate regulon sensor histidine kinase PhoR